MSLPPHPGARHVPHQVNHDYDRGGALAYLAPMTSTAGKCWAAASKPPASPFHRLVGQVMAAEPYASADRVFWIVDKGSSHHGQAAIDRLAQQYPNAIMVHTPVHASWLNRIRAG